jgi:hypothetical protein
MRTLTVIAVIASLMIAGFSHAGRARLLPSHDESGAHVVDRGSAGASPSHVAADAPIRFAPIDIIIDTDDQPLAVYQVELIAKGQHVQIVGLEGGEHPAFREPPHYDPVARQRPQERVVLAAFNTAEASQLPAGKVRVATIHVQITGAGEPTLEAKLDVCAGVDGKPVKGTVQAQLKGIHS